ncbi:hypothetical protein ARMSODRAFT_1026679 [Armillaria solidipes]|uniref:Uncharacterized protein n=1 Tax=Armillaria solidipes TaxID=1076256 RepID=A0A2H3AN65_9AGAR|nr:hypothetical protein ARMSODRAFT_1026679 [Armillaria solidipes]
MSLNPDPSQTPLGCSAITLQTPDFDNMANTMARKQAFSLEELTITMEEQARQAAEEARVKLRQIAELEQELHVAKEAHEQHAWYWQLPQRKGKEPDQGCNDNPPPSQSGRSRYGNRGTDSWFLNPPTAEDLQYPL